MMFSQGGHSNKPIFQSAVSDGQLQGKNSATKIGMCITYSWARKFIVTSSEK